MKNLNNLKKTILLGALLISSTTVFADDIWFISPQPGQPIQGNVQIKIQPPYGNNIPVNVWMEYDMGREYIVWQGQLTPQNSYTATVDVSKFRPGKYKIEAQYFIQGGDFDVEIDIWIGGNTDPNGQYYPQQ